MSRALPRQLLLFVLIGGLQLLLDWAVFVGLTHVGVSLPAANVAGRVSGALFGFWLNGRYTFAAGGVPRLDAVHMRRFLIAWLALTALSTAFLASVQAQFDLQAAWLAKPLIEAIMAAIGFVIWRQWVYR